MDKLMRNGVGNHRDKEAAETPAVGSTTEFYKTEGEYAVELAKWLAERERRLH